MIADNERKPDRAAPGQAKTGRYLSARSGLFIPTNYR